MTTNSPSLPLPLSLLLGSQSMYTISLAMFLDLHFVDFGTVLGTTSTRFRGGFRGFLFVFVRLRVLDKSVFFISTCHGKDRNLHYIGVYSLSSLSSLTSFLFLVFLRLELDGGVRMFGLELGTDLKHSLSQASSSLSSELMDGSRLITGGGSESSLREATRRRLFLRGVWTKPAIRLSFIHVCTS